MISAEIVRDRANTDGEFQLMARHWDGRLRLEMGVQRYDVVLRAGKIAEFTRGDENAQSDVKITGPLQAWSEGFAFRGLTLTGDNVGHIWPYYGAIFRLVSLVRETLSGRTRETVGQEVDRQFDTAVGRYVYVRIQGIQYRVYYEEAGQGTPMVLQHTAGADGREWRFMLEDAELQKRYRMIAYDLPYHGRSLPPTAVKWWAQEYRLTKELLMDSVVAISHALKANGGVYMGCAMGGALALDLAVYRPDSFRAVIGINSGLGSASPNRASAQVTIDGYSHPRVLSSRYVGVSTYGNTSPDAPEPYRREVQWIYNQSGPASIGGDFHYYLMEHSLTPADVQNIDTSKVRIHLLSGEYGPSAGPNGAAAVASLIKGATHTIIKGANYLPMTDDYQRFRQSLLPVLDRINDI